jgi:hypothetical protein
VGQRLAQGVLIASEDKTQTPRTKKGKEEKKKRKERKKKLSDAA